MPIDLPDYAKATETDFSSVPVIDISKHDDLATLGAALVSAAQTSGFFYVAGHGVDQAMVEAAFAAARRFFALPEEEKAQIAVQTDQRGWMAQGMTRLEGSRTHDAKEVFFWGWEIEATDPDLALPLVACNRWPDDFCPGLRRDVTPYYLSIVGLGRQLMSALALGLGKDARFFDAAYEKPLARGQLVYYPAMSSEDVEAGRFGAAAHTDFGALTILKQDDVGGLQVRNRAGTWISAPPIPDTFVCNIGDLLEQWTNGRLVSTPHRVLNTAGHDRFSIPVFFDPSSATVIDPADFAEPDEALAFPPISAGAHISGRNKKNFSQYEKR